MRSRIAHATRLAAALCATGLLLASCSRSYPQGPDGRIVEKDRDTYRVGKTTMTRFYLTVQTEDDKAKKFRVSHQHFNRCYHGSSYPKCTTQTDRD